ncbi:MAG: transketolase [Chloroflexota bacterium]|nr:transketolase [Chloroflexota bacterium]
MIESQTRAERAFDLDASRERCARMRRRILEVSQGISAIHIGGAFSCLEVVDTIYFSLKRATDTFVLSKGHGSAAQYVALEELGVLSHADLETLCKPTGRLGTHPDYGLPGIEASTGSLGHGLGIAMGMALADRLNELDRTVYVVMSDGELQEGSVWEAMMLAPTLRLTNLVAFVDNNDMQSFGHTSKTHPNFYPVLDKARAFGWEAVEIDGHDQTAIYAAVSARRASAPLMVIARTTKGKGVSYMENVPMWHYRSPSPAEYEQALSELSKVQA